MFRREATHRLSRGYGGSFTCFIRNDSGPVDLAGKVIVAQLRPYNRNRQPTPVTAVQLEPGEMSVSIPETQLNSLLRDSLYRLDITADGELVYEALLEIV